ncbi:MAG: cytochrome c [Methylomonas sp.]|nr:cytochrome c [Methylomonas sp.]
MRPVWLLALVSAAVLAEQPTPQRQQELIDLLKHDCGSCHGLPPKGGLGPSLMPEALANKTDAFLLEVIQRGKAGSAMPPWQQFLSLEETAWLVQQLRQEGWK